MNVTINTIDILLVEDDPGDALMTQEAFEYNKLRNQLFVVTDGVQALRFLRHEAPYENSPRPGLILLDLNLPRKDGREVLAEAKSTPDLMSIPVVVLTTSEAEEDASCVATTCTRTPTSPNRWTSNGSSRSFGRSTISSSRSRRCLTGEADRTTQQRRKR